MDLTNKKSLFPAAIRRSDLLGTSELSPVTNLAVNLSVLSTSVAGTPNRRISWSNPIPGGDKIGLHLEDVSPSETDSPTFQDAFFPPKKESRSRIRKGVVRRNVLSNTEEENKENVSPKTQIQFSPEDSDIGSFKCGSQESDSFKFGSQDSFKCDSQDSGYSATTGPSFTGRRSAVFTFNEDDSMDCIFQLEESEEHHDVLAVPDNMSSLLTKPLVSSKSSSSKSKGKLPIRRCLSMQMEYAAHNSSFTEKSDCDTSSVPSTSQPEKSIIEHHVTVTASKCAFKRPEPPADYSSSQMKRRKSSPCIEPMWPQDSSEQHPALTRSHSETAATIMCALVKADLQPELVGDGTRSYALPLVRGRHQDLKCISVDTLATLMRGGFKDELEKFTLVDCRYPYEYEGGHISGALNIFTKEDIMEAFFKDSSHSTKRTAIIFHCEFSSERAPNLCRFLRNTDREVNEGHYPRLHHPEMYILEGGYKCFYERFRELCKPQSYKPMNHKDHGYEMRHFRAKSKSWGAAEHKGRVKLRSQSKPVNI